MKYKRIVEFVSYWDKIPSDAVLLHTMVKEVELYESPEEKDAREAKRAINGDDNGPPKASIVKGVYEISEEDFQQLCKEGFFTRTENERLTEYRETIGWKQPA